MNPQGQRTTLRADRSCVVAVATTALGPSVIELYVQVFIKLRAK